MRLLVGLVEVHLRISYRHGLIEPAEVAQRGHTVRRTDRQLTDDASHDATGFLCGQRQDDQELVASAAGDDVACPQRVPHRLRDGRQHGVPGSVALRAFRHDSSRGRGQGGEGSICTRGSPTGLDPDALGKGQGVPRIR